MTLTTYRTDARRLLHDPLGDLWSDADMLAFINEAIKVRDRVTGCNRALKTLTLTAGTDTFAFSALTPATPVPFDVIGVNVVFSGVRYRLTPMSFSQLNRRVRVLSPVLRDLPCAWARYGQTTVYVAPAPAASTSLEVDTCVYATDLAADSDDDGISYPFTEPVKYWVAYLAKLNERRPQQADEFEARFQASCLLTTQARVGRVP